MKKRTKVIAKKRSLRRMVKKARNGGRSASNKSKSSKVRKIKTYLRSRKRR